MAEQTRFFIVNTGPGEKENITLKGHRILQAADLVIASTRQRERFAEELAGKEVIDGGHGLFSSLALRRLSAEEAEQQEATMREKLESAHAAGQTIVLIESGDIGLFSPYRGYLTAFRHFKPQLVPGASSFNAANALLAQTILGEGNRRLLMSDLESFMQADRNCLPDVWVLFCMGLELPKLIKQIQALYPAATSVALIINAGYDEHEVLRCSVSELGQYEDREISFPYCIIYIGVD